MAITQQASKLRANEAYNGGSSGVRTAYIKVEFAAVFNQVQYLVGSGIKTGTPGTYKVQFALTDTVAFDTVNNAYLPVRNGVVYNDKSANGWKDATFGGAASKQIGLVTNNSIIHMSTDVMNLPSIPRADGKPGAILLIKVTQSDSAGTFSLANGSSSAWDQARGKPWFTEWYSKSVNFDAIADLTRIPTGGPFNEDFCFPGFPIVTNTASDLPTDLLMFTGDSRKSAAYMTNNFANQSRMAAMSLSTPAHPISTVNAAGSGKSQTEYLAIAMDMLNAGVRPTVIALPGYSQNGFSTASNFINANANFMTSVRAIPGLENVKFVLDTDYVMGSYSGSTPNGEGYSAAAHARTLANGTTVFVFDSDPIITDYTTTPGQPKIKAPYLVGGDSIHAGPAGINAMAYGAGPNASLTSVYATAFGITNVAVIPGAPSVGTATAGALSASVAGTAPAATNGGAITGYRATSSPGGITATSTTLPVNVTGLTAGTAYTFTLAALNSAGYGPESFASNSVTPTSVPATPTVTSVTVSPATATGSTTFSAVVAGENSPSQAVTWKATAGTISSSGGFTAPAATSSAQNITVTATSVADTSKSGTATVTIAAAPAPTPASRTVTVTLKVDKDTPAANLTGIRVSFFDEPTPDLHTSARFTAANETTDASGQMTFVAQSMLPVGGSGSVVAQLADGRNFVVTVTVGA
jgi:hypothetical protein